MHGYMYKLHVQYCAAHVHFNYNYKINFYRCIHYLVDLSSNCKFRIFMHLAIYKSVMIIYTIG
jgi:UV DNA damage repair endonuclease